VSTTLSEAYSAFLGKFYLNNDTGKPSSDRVVILSIYC